MRNKLLESFDKIYILDLHGNSNKKEVCEDGSPDQNVFDIMQGVSINIFIKTNQKRKNELGKVFHFELQGKRDLKYQFLNKNNLKTIHWKNLKYKKPNYFFVPKDFGLADKYEKGFKLNELFINNSTGIETQRDAASIHFTKKELQHTIDVFLNNDIEDIRNILSIGKDGRDWKVITAKEDLVQGYNITTLQFKPFDERYIPYTGNSKGIIAYPRNEINQHILKGNYCIVSPRFFKEPPSYFVSNTIIGHKVLSAYDKNFIFPLYHYENTNGQHTILQSSKRKPNLKKEILNHISNKLRLPFSPEKLDSKDAFTPINILDYIYAILHSSKYREKYKEFLKIDFPRVPYPTDSKTFWKLVRLGGELRQIHLLESPIVEQFITQYPEDGDNFVSRKISKIDPGFVTDEQNPGFGKVWINDNQYFDKVPEIAWDFYIGGYQPAQKWLKDRKDRKLEYEDILHYQKIIVALSETDRLMKEIDKIDFEDDSST
ncbi:hypothetical protein MACH07_15690 [Flagellimonas marinaquae]|uniref:Type ISP restriction-modification enzyme LLaBIII C-terminal specificity domain-containing protein n=1 Tax=Flagellimonas marinaquae TaxID=254955 RepID=A0AA48HAX7_9FLAO|nr:hypothetical protein MACH07_15690 [Allomuricauda aquimarina]